jgi:hypothetical protein
VLEVGHRMEDKGCSDKTMRTPGIKMFIALISVSVLIPGPSSNADFVSYAAN